MGKGTEARVGMRKAEIVMLGPMRVVSMLKKRASTSGTVRDEQHNRWPIRVQWVWDGSQNGCGDLMLTSCFGLVDRWRLFMLQPVDTGPVGCFLSKRCSGVVRGRVVVMNRIV